VPRFEPFCALRYDAAGLRARDTTLDDVIAPPYDVIDPGLRDKLASRSPYNSVLVELPIDDPARGHDRYQVAASLIGRWRSEGVLMEDRGPGFYAYRMSFTAPDGKPAQTTGVLGALEAGPPDETDVLPHERTMPKPKGERLELLRTTRVNLSPVWGLSLARGLSDAIPTSSPPDEAATDDDGVLHQLWAITDAGTVRRISELVSSAPVVIADGHHRFETALAYRAERRAATADRPGDYDLVMALVVELAEDELTVRPIHRLLSGLPGDFDVAAGLETSFELTPVAREEMARAVAGRASMGLVTRTGAWLITPKPDTEAAAGQDLDSRRLEVGGASLPDHDLTYEADLDRVMAAVDSGYAQAGVCLRPASVAVIADTAWDRRRMPPKTTFFQPKPRTGMAFRRLSD
jgi:uncharacterized protein (DUF1015 family)